MIFFVLTVFLTVLQTGYFQEAYNENIFNVPPKLGDPVPVLGDQSWPMQTIHTVQGKFFGQALRNINSKPCTGRRNLRVLDEQWIPTFTSKITKPVNNFDNSNMKLQEKNEETNNAEMDVPIAKQVNEENVAFKDLDNSENNLYKTRNSLSVDNTVDNTIEDAAQVYLPMSEDNLLISEDRTGVEDQEVAPKEDSSTIEADVTSEEYPEEDKVSENLEVPNVAAKTDSLNNVKSSDKCNSKNGNSDDISHATDSRRSLSNFNKKNSFVDNLNADSETEKLSKPNKIDEYLQLPAHNNMRKPNSMQLNPHKTVPMQTEDLKADMLEPTKGSGISELTESRKMLMDHSRLCYACSTASNPTCWAPDKKTTLKYCRKGHEACVTKTFQTGKTETLVRDCGKSCEDGDIPGLVPKYKSCSVCHTDLCNSAYSINVNNLIFAFLLIIFTKSMS